MTIEEFRCWLDGFGEAIDGAPTEEQWEKIKAKLEEVQNRQYHFTPFIDPYRQPSTPNYPWTPDIRFTDMKWTVSDGTSEEEEVDKPGYKATWGLKS